MKAEPTESTLLTGSYISGGELRRIYKIVASVGGEIIIDERADDETYITVGAPEGTRTAVALNAAQLWDLGEAIIALFGGLAMRVDDQAALRNKLFDVLFDNEARCLDDNIDREVVLNALMKALQER